LYDLIEIYKRKFLTDYCNHNFGKELKVGEFLRKAKVIYINSYWVLSASV